MAQKPKPPPQPDKPDDPAIYGGQWGGGDGTQKPGGTPPTDRPGTIDEPPDPPPQPPVSGS